MKTFLMLCVVLAVGAGCVTTQTRTVGKLTINGGTYEGEISSGKANGEGSLTSTNGVKYVGGFRDNEFNGQGTLTKADGTTQSGSWKEGSYLGSSPAQTNAPPSSEINKEPMTTGGQTNTVGKLTINAGAYEGEIRDGKANGKGTLTYEDGTKYVCEWKDGQMNGQVTCIWTNGLKYVSTWTNGVRVGPQVTLLKPDGTTASGLVMYWGGIYEGEIKDGKANGQGTGTWLRNGLKYVGEWTDDKQNGHGTLTWHDGSQYVCEWKDGRMNGQVTCIWKNGLKYVGTWTNGVRVGREVTVLNPDGTKDKWNEEVWFTETNNLDLAFLERVKKAKVPGQAVSNAVPQPTPETRTVRGELKFYPSNVKSAEAWYGHNFVVAGTPILPTEQVPEDTLKKFVGTMVIIQGVWQSGTRWKPSEEEKNMQMPVDPDKDVVIVGDGLKAQFIAPLER